MAVYTEVSFEELEGFLAGYDIGVVHVFKGIAEGVENSNFFLQTDKGTFILTLYEKRVHADDLPFFLGLLGHLARRDVACPTPIADRSGALFGTLSGRPAAILTFLDGVSLRNPGAPHCQAAGRALAQVHHAGAQFGIHRANALGPAGWAELARDGGPQADTVSLGLRALIEEELETVATLWPESLPQGVIHADLFPDNVLFVDDTVSGLIDFYFACNDSLAYDLAIMLNAWCFEADGSYNLTKGKALAGGYQEERPLSAAETAAMPLLARGAALRFTLTRLYDWLHRDPAALVRPKDPREFARRLRFHRAADSPAAYGF